MNPMDKLTETASFFKLLSRMDTGPFLAVRFAARSLFPDEKFQEKPL